MSESTIDTERPARRDLYVLVAFVLVVLLVVQTLNRRWSNDFWLHEATLDAFRHDLWHPKQPLIGTHAPFEYYSPYTFVLAVVARASGWSTVVILQLAAVFNLVLFLVSFRLFVARLTSRSASTFALIATLVFWGVHPWRWSGFLNLDSIGFGLPYPSMFATGLALLVAWALLRYDDTRANAWLVLVGGGFAVVMLTHPFTGVWTTVLLGAIAIHRRLYRPATLVPLGATLVVVVAALAIWPYYPFFRLFTGGEHTEGAVLYHGVPWRLFATLPGLVALWRRFRREWTDPLVLAFAGAVVLYLLGGISSSHDLGRVLPLVVLPLHIGEGELIAAMVQPHVRARRGLVAGIAVCGVVGLAGIAPAFASMIPHRLLPPTLRDKSSLRPLTSHYRGLRGNLPTGTIVVVEQSLMEEVAPAHGLYVLATSADVFVKDKAARRSASNVILSSKTKPANRTRLLDQYHVGGVICATQRCRNLFPEFRVRQVEDWTLINLASRR